MNKQFYFGKLTLGRDSPLEIDTMRGHYNMVPLQNESIHLSHLKSKSPHQSFQKRSRLKSLKQLREPPAVSEFVHPSIFNSINSQNTNNDLMSLLEKKLARETIQNREEINKEENSVQALDTEDDDEENSGAKSMNRGAQRTKVKNCQSNKLFEFFQDTCARGLPVEKVEREKVNFWAKQFTEIKNELEAKLQQNKQKQIEKHLTVENKYKQLQKFNDELKEMASELKSLKKSSLGSHPGGSVSASLPNPSKKFSFSKRQHYGDFEAQNLSNFTLKPPSLKERYSVIEGTISQLKQECSVIEQEVRRIKTIDRQIEEEWLGFLILWLQKGYYLKNGSLQILREVKRLKYDLKQNDLSEILDSTAKKYLLGVYKELKPAEDTGSNSSSLVGVNENQKMKKLSLDKLPHNRNRIKSTIEMSNLTKQNNLKVIYSDTREIMSSLLKDHKFRASPKKDSFLPSIHQSSGQVSKETIEIERQKEERTIEINRINNVYGVKQPERCRLMKRLLFGMISA